MKKELLEIEKLDYQAIGAEISHELAAKMVKDHHDKFTVENSYSYCIGANVINQILSQPGCVGLRFFEALNEKGEKTLVYVGVDTKGRSIIEITTVNEGGELAIVKASIGDQLLAPRPINWFN